MAAQLRCPPPPIAAVRPAADRRSLAGTLTPPSIHLRPRSLPLLRARSANPNLSQSFPSPGLAVPDAGTGGPAVPPSGGSGKGGGGGGGGGPRDRNPPDDPSDPSDGGGGGGGGGLFDLFLGGWQSRVAADPQFAFKVLMEELVGVSACALGDMASRPNFGLNELDFVFSTLVVGSIVNFVLMYLLAPTAASSSAASAVAAALPSHMFEAGAYSPLARLGTFAYKGATFAAVGFAAGLAGTAISNGLIALRKKMDPEFESPNKPPPTVLNAVTWALHMGVSSNFRYQALNGVEFVMAKALPPAGFKASVLVLRCMNNVMGGMSFVALARLTGSQKSGEEDKGEVKERLISMAAATEETVEELKGTSDPHESFMHPHFH